MKSQGYEYIKYMYRYFQPHTPKAALLAIEQGLLPYEAYIYWASSVKPLYEEPFDTHEIDRILARTEIDLETLLLIIHILQKLIVSKDSETALFAAESLNRIEIRFTDHIEEQRKAIEKEPQNSRLYHQLGRTYYEFSKISGGRETLRNFYLREAYEQMKHASSLSEPPEKEDYLLTVNILIALGLNEQAHSVIQKGIGRYGISVDFLLLQAESAFNRRAFAVLLPLCERLQHFDLDHETALLIDFWKGVT